MIEKELSKIRLDYLNTFIELVRLKSFSETARVLEKTQGTISQHLKELEDVFGCELITRSSKSFEITDYGKSLLESAQKIITEIENIAENINKDKGISKIKILITSSSIPGEYILPKIFTQFQKTHKDFEFQIKISNSRDSLEDLLKRKVHFAAIGGLFNKQRDLFQEKEIGSDKVVILAKENHPIFNNLESYENEEEINSELIKYPWIFREKGSATREKFFKSIKFSEMIKINLEFYNNLAIIQALENSDALTALSSFTYDKFKLSNKIKIVKHNNIPEIKRKFYFIKLKDYILNNLEKELWNGI